MSTSDRDDMTTVVMACEEFMARTGIAPERLRELLALGWLESHWKFHCGRQRWFGSGGIALWGRRRVRKACYPAFAGRSVMGD